MFLIGRQTFRQIIVVTLEHALKRRHESHEMLAPVSVSSYAGSLVLSKLTVRNFYVLITTLKRLPAPNPPRDSIKIHTTDTLLPVSCFQVIFMD